MNAIHPRRQMTQAWAHHVDALNVAQDPSIATATPQQLERWRLVQRRALFEWNAATPASRAFLAKCGLPADLSRGLRAAGSSYLLVPQRDCMGELWALQYLPPRFRPARVNPRAADKPLRMVNPREAGLHFWVGNVPEGDGAGATVGITEYLHDAVTWHGETDSPCLVAFSPENLATLAKLVLAAFPAARVAIWARREQQAEAAHAAARAVPGVRALADLEALGVVTWSRSEERAAAAQAVEVQP